MERLQKSVATVKNRERDTLPRGDFEDMNFSLNEKSVQRKLCHGHVVRLQKRNPRKRCRKKKRNVVFTRRKAGG